MEEDVDGPPVDICPAWLASIGFSRVRFVFRACKGGKVPGFLGTEIRGSIGRQLKRIQGCTGDRNEDCKRCPENRLSSCAYASFFEHDRYPATGKTSSYNKGIVLKLVSHSFNAAFSPDDLLTFDIVVFGNLVSHIPSIVQAFGFEPLIVGGRGVVFNLAQVMMVSRNGEVHQCPSSHAPSLEKLADLKKNRIAVSFSGNLTLRCLSPLQIKLRGEIMTKPEDMTFKRLVVEILARTERIALDHCQWPYDENGRKKLWEHPLAKSAENVVLVGHEAVWEKIFFRNKAKRTSGGFLGEFHFNGQFEEFTNMLAAAEIISVGKGASAGLGNIAFEC